MLVFTAPVGEHYSNIYWTLKIQRLPNYYVTVKIIYEEKSSL